MPALPSRLVNIGLPCFSLMNKVHTQRKRSPTTTAAITMMMMTVDVSIVSSSFLGGGDGGDGQMVPS